MLNNLEEGKPNKSINVYGRNYTEDQEAYYHDITLRQVMAIFDNIDFIENAQHLSDITGFEIKDSDRKLEILRNLGMLTRSSEGYYPTEKYVYSEQPESDNIELRAAEHAVKLAQVASQISKVPDMFADRCEIFCTSPEKNKDFRQKLAKLLFEFRDESLKLPKEEKTELFTFAAAIFSNSISKKEVK